MDDYMDIFNGEAYTPDEQIRLCLNCPKLRCDDCIGRKGSPHSPGKLRVPDLKKKVLCGVLAGKDDRLIARELSITPGTVSRCRRSMGLPRMSRGGISECEFLRLYNSGKTDREIAEALGITVKGVYSRRKRRGLPCHPARRGRNTAEGGTEDE